MFNFFNSSKLFELNSIISAINKSQAIIEFNTDGTIITANENFLRILGYSLDEVINKHHSMFVDSLYKSSTEYTKFWEDLRRGEYQTGEYKRLGINNKEVWIQASYNPILDKNGKVLKIVKFGSDITTQKINNADYIGQIQAIRKSQAVIEFNMDGTIITANENFLKIFGYNLDEIIGKHQSMFVDASYKSTPEHIKFWEDLRRGEYQTGEYKRMSKNGKEIWIQASYNPILDNNKKPIKIVEFLSAKDNNIGVEDTIETLTALASGDLTKKIVNEHNGSFADIKNSLNSTIDKLINVIEQIRISSDSVSDAANEISEGSNDLSRRTESQAASIEETTAAVDKLTVTVRQNANNSDEAAKIASKARDLADKGGKVVEKAVGAMEKIEVSSKKVSDIISVIDEIAFQTNLLALNAAVEAARAGDGGKGFAVVASEVRSLASRSAASAKEIRLLIEESSKHVKEGAELVNATGSSLSDIVISTENVHNITSNVASASKEQAADIEEINTSIKQMDEMTQQNAALVEENSAALQSLADQVKHLKLAISHFKYSNSFENQNSTSNQLKTNSIQKISKVSPNTNNYNTKRLDDDWKEF